MTAEEKKAYNNGFILGMASKGVIKVTEGHEYREEKPIRVRVIDKIGLVPYTEVV